MGRSVSEKVIYPELSYEILGAAFNIFNEIGFGMNEKYYQRAFAHASKQAGLSFEQEKLVKLYYGGQRIGSYFLDFIAEDRVIVELKVRPALGYVHVKQAMSYLKATGRKLTLLIYFTRNGVKRRRIVNLK